MPKKYKLLLWSDWNRWISEQNGGRGIPLGDLFEERMAVAFSIPLRDFKNWAFVNADHPDHVRVPSRVPPRGYTGSLDDWIKEQIARMLEEGITPHETYPKGEWY